MNLFDPSAVILNGGLVGAGSMLIDPLTQAVVEHAVTPHGPDGPAAACPVRVSDLGPAAAAMGAAMGPLKHYFEFENIRL